MFCITLINLQFMISHILDEYIHKNNLKYN